MRIDELGEAPISTGRRRSQGDAKRQCVCRVRHRLQILPRAFRETHHVPVRGGVTRSGTRQAPCRMRAVEAPRSRLSASVR